MRCKDVATHQNSHRMLCIIDIRLNWWKLGQFRWLSLLLEIGYHKTSFPPYVWKAHKNTWADDYLLNWRSTVNNSLERDPKRSDLICNQRIRIHWECTTDWELNHFLVPHQKMKRIRTVTLVLLLLNVGENRTPTMHLAYPHLRWFVMLLILQSSRWVGKMRKRDEWNFHFVHKCGIIV